MSSTMNLDGARELLEDVAQQLEEIDRIYADAVKTDSIVSVARPKVKTCLEHLRSVLEYVAANLKETLPPISNSKAKKAGKRDTYFPYGTSAKLYAESLERNLPGLDAKYRLLIDGLQPHICGDSWLVHLSQATNFNKHVDLEMQERKNVNPTLTIGNLVRLGGGASIGNLVLDGKTVNPKGPLTAETAKEDIDLPALIPVVKEYGGVKFILKNRGVDVLELLRNSHQRISQLVAELAQE